jgi:peroxiredoxin
MIKIFIVYFSVLLFSSNSFGQRKISTFKIEGTVSGFSNGTKLYLNDATVNLKQIDSAYINEGKFVFKGNLKKAYLNANISTTDFADRVYFWLESGITYFSADKEKFNNAVIKGTKIQDEQNELNKLRDTLMNTEQVDYSFIKSNPNSIISASVLAIYCNSWGKDTVTTLFKVFSKEVKASAYGREINDFISFNRNIKIGDKFVDFSQKDMAGKNVKLSDFKGKVVLLEFWGSWCGPCREQNPSLLEIYTEFRKMGFEILGVATEANKNDWIKAIKADGLTWTNVTDLKGSANKAAIVYGVSGYPMNFLIDRNGIVIAKEVYGEALREILLKIL